MFCQRRESDSLALANKTEGVFSEREREGREGFFSLRVSEEEKNFDIATRKNFFEQETDRIFKEKTRSFTDPFSLFFLSLSLKKLFSKTDRGVFFMMTERGGVSLRGRERSFGTVCRRFFSEERVGVCPRLRDRERRDVFPEEKGVFPENKGVLVAQVKRVLAH